MTNLQIYDSITPILEHIKPSETEKSIISKMRENVVRAIRSLGMLLISGSCALQDFESEKSLNRMNLELKLQNPTFTILQRQNPDKPRSNCLPPFGIALNPEWNDIYDPRIGFLMSTNMFSNTLNAAIPIISEIRNPIVANHLIIPWASMVWLGARDSHKSEAQELAANALSLGIPLAVKHGADDEDYTGLSTTILNIQSLYNGSTPILPILRGFNSRHNISRDDIERVFDLTGTYPIIDTSHGNNLTRCHGSSVGQRHALERVTGLQLEGVQISGIMSEVMPIEGQDKSGKTEGMSRMDPCLGIASYKLLIEEIARSYLKV